LKALSFYRTRTGLGKFFLGVPDSRRLGAAIEGGYAQNATVIAPNIIVVPIFNTKITATYRLFKCATKKCENKFATSVRRSLIVTYNLQSFGPGTLGLIWLFIKLARPKSRLQTRVIFSKTC
jgi:hypothetical protein